MASLASIRDAIASTVASAISGLQVHARPPAKPVPPCLLVIPSEANFDVAMGRGTVTWQFDLIVLVPTADLVVGQTLLDPYVTHAGASSVQAAIFTTPGLGLSGTDAHVTGMSDYGAVHEYGGANHCSATLHLTVHTAGSS